MVVVQLPVMGRAQSYKIGKIIDIQYQSLVRVLRDGFDVADLYVLLVPTHCAAKVRIDLQERLPCPLPDAGVSLVCPLTPNLPQSQVFEVDAVGVVFFAKPSP